MRVCQPAPSALNRAITSASNRSVVTVFGWSDFGPPRGRMFRVFSPGQAFFDMLGVCAEFETNLRKERQLEGIAKAKAEGRYNGRPRSVDVEAVRRLKAEGKGASEIARDLGIGRASVYRVLGEGEVTVESSPYDCWA